MLGLALAGTKVDGCVRVRDGTAGKAAGCGVRIRGRSDLSSGGAEGASCFV